MFRKLARRLTPAWLRKIYRRSPLPYWFPQYLFTDTQGATYGILSAAPPIFYAPYWVNEKLVLHQDMSPLFDRLAKTRAYFFYCWFWWIEEPPRVSAVKRFEQAHRRRYPKHQIIHLCNTARQCEVFRDAGLDALFCNHNAFVDEKIFFPIPRAQKKWDAVYDARFKYYKRHALARQVPSLALIYDWNPLIDDPAYVRQMRQQFTHAHLFNHRDAATYQHLTPAQVNECLNECRVGLCLSAEEGANYASIQYLLCGMPIVSTHSRGGRDVFFDDEYVLIVDDAPEAVCAGVETMLKRTIAPETIRARTLEKIARHRRTLIERVQRIYAQEGVARNFADEWDSIFFNKLMRYQRHDDSTTN